MDDPVTLLRANHRAALDRQAQLGTQARALAHQVETITAELNDIRRTIASYAAILRIINTLDTRQKTPTKEEKDA